MEAEVPKVVVKELENGRMESYTWEHSFPAGIPTFAPTYRIPTFSTGILSGSWNHHSAVEFLEDGNMQMFLPYPDLAGFYAGFKWRIQDVSITQPTTPEHPKGPHHLKVDRSNPNAPGWMNGGVELYDGPYRWISIENPFKIRVSLDVLGVNISNHHGPHLSPLIAGAFNNTPELSDVKVVCDGETFLLASPVFKGMFVPDFKKMAENKLEIVGVDKDVCKLMLEWIYTVDIRAKLRTLGQRLDLYKVAHFYLLDPLKNSLVREILASVTSEGALEVYLFGDLYGEPRFKTTAVELMRKEPNGGFSNKEVFQEFCERFPKLLQEILANWEMTNLD